MNKQEITIRQKQRIGAKKNKLRREYQTKFVYNLLKETYEDGFYDGVDTERKEQERIKATKRWVYR